MPVIQPMRRPDLDAVCRIASSAFPVPWTAAEFERELAQEHAVARVLRAELSAPVCAFLHYWVLADEAQIMNLATDPALRRRGYARALLHDAFNQLRSARVPAVVLEVRHSNQEAIGLYRSLGFAEAGRRPRYYADNQEDGLIMRASIRTRGLSENFG